MGMHDEGGHAQAERHSNRRLIDRMLFFSDAVFAIVLTLLVLELRAPEMTDEVALRAALVQLSPKFVAFAASFSLVSIFWLAHMSTTRRLVVFDWTVAWLNLVFLFTIAIMPFVSALLGTRGPHGLSWQVYSASLVAASFANVVLVFAVMRDRGRLVGGVTWRETVYRVFRAASPGIAFGAGLWFGLTGDERLSSLCWILIPVFLAFARLLAPPATGDASGAD